MKTLLDTTVVSETHTRGVIMVNIKIPKGLGWEFAHSLIRSDSLILMSDCERFAKIAQDQ